MPSCNEDFLKMNKELKSLYFKSNISQYMEEEYLMNATKNAKLKSDFEDFLNKKLKDS